MAANKFATMLHKNTNNITIILIYAILEWTLILLLLLNSLFSYFIIKFSQFFGLKPPCLWCTRVDHIFEPGKNNNMHIDLLCESHVKQISKLGYCSNHQKLVESVDDMCEDCLSSKPNFRKVLKEFTLFGLIQSDGEKVVVENGHGGLKCSCCGVAFDSELYHNSLIKRYWDGLGDTKNGKFVIEGVDDDHMKDEHSSDYEISDFSTDRCEVEHCFEKKDGNVMICDVNGDFNVISTSMFELKELGNNVVEKVDVILEDEKEEEIVEEKAGIATKDEAIQVCVDEDGHHLEFFIDYSGHRLVRVELIDSATEDDQNRDIAKYEDQCRSDERGFNSGVEVHEEEAKDEDACRGIEENAEHFAQMNVESGFSGLESMAIEEDENSLAVDTQDKGNARVTEAAEQEEDNHQACEVIAQTRVNETEADVSIGTAIPDLETADDIQTQDPSVSFVPEADNDHELRAISVEVNEQVINNRSTFCSDLNEIEEEKVPDTPTSMNSFHLLQKKLLLLEKKDSVNEDSLDGSVTSEFENDDGVVTIEQLKTALRAERKALNALYSELEEERNASAISASQTMAMISRLQEEKSAMQIEALQYQRMMDEQAEYDQEALQLLNELMVKREKEKEELEKELEIHRKKLLEFETKEKLRILRRSKDGSAKSGFSSPSCSNAEDSDAASFDLNQVAKDEEGLYSHRESDNENTPLNAVLNLEESVADFEEERLSILEQLKVLEEKLMTLDDDDLLHFEDVKPIENHEENGSDIDENGHLNGIDNGHSNGFPKESNGKRSIGPKGKSLLPLFDAESDDTIEGNENGFESNEVDESCIPKIELENKRFAVEEELDHLYERLQALEEDREFLKHCIGSLNKGDKGMHILHEILQHLRDLRNVDLRVKNLNDGATV